MKLKPVDKRILELLQQGDMCVPRITKIAHQVKLPTSTVQSKINKMQQEGIVKEFIGLVDPEKVGKGFVGFLMGQAKLGKETDFNKVIPKLKKIKQIQEIFFVTGDYDYLVKFRVKDQKEYYEVAQKIARCFEVRGKGFVAPRCFKESPKVEIL